MRLSYLIFPSCMLISSALGSFFTDAGMSWYRTLVLPSFVPPSWVFAVVWNAIFICITLAAILVWEHGIGMRKLLATKLFFANLFLIPYWCFVFFYEHKMGPAIGVAIINTLVVIWWLLVSARISRVAALLIVPNAAWLLFAVYLNYVVWKLNAATGIYRFL